MKPSTLEKDPAVGRVILAVIAMGGGKSAACAQAGIDRSTLRAWEKRGEQGKEPYASFVTDLRKAEHADKVTYLSAVNGAAKKGDWRAASWALEKRYPGEFGNRVDIHVQGDAVRDLLERLEHGLDAETYARVLGVLVGPGSEGATEEEIRH